jgi:hypothetical protein
VIGVNELCPCQSDTHVEFYYRAPSGHSDLMLSETHDDPFRRTMFTGGTAEGVGIFGIALKSGVSRVCT